MNQVPLFPGWYPIALLACTFCGCAPIAPLPVEDVTPVTEYFFEEDADPVYARLPFVDTELLIQPFPGATADDLRDAYRQAGAEVLEELEAIQLVTLKVLPGSLTKTATHLAKSGLVETLQKNYILTAEKTPNDPDFSRQPHLSSSRVNEAWDITVGDFAIVVGIVDTGVDGNHPELKNKLLAGWNVYDANTNFSDIQGHGTYVAGVAAASTDDQVGVAGVTWASPILPVRAADSGGKSTARHVAAGILWAVDHGAKVINVSFAPLWADRVVHSAAEQAFQRGCLVVISAGNGGGTNTAAGYAEAMFVGALDDRSQIAVFSDRGPFVDLMAPGTAILSTARGGGYGIVDGTSFAAPIVSGVAALAWSVNPRLRPVSIVDALLMSAKDLGTAGLDATYAHGAVDARRAVELAAATVETEDKTPPTLAVTRPVSGESLSGRFTASVTATDAAGIADVVLNIDGIAFATDTRSPYQFLIDTSRFSAGSHELAFVATDVAGNSSAPRKVSVSFGALSSSAGTGSSSGVAFSSPASGSEVTGDVTLRATVSDADGLAVIEWLVDGVPVFSVPVSGISSGVSFVWRTAGVSRGRHEISIIVTDSTGQRSTGRISLTKR